MRSVLGVSVGATVIQLARPRRDAELIEVQSITARGEEVASLAAETVAAALDSRAEPTAVAITYSQPEQADQLQAALDQLQVSRYELVSEVSAALEYFDAQGAEPELGAVAVCDLGASGFTVTIVDWETGDVHLSQRTTDISGDVVDGLIRDHQLSLGTVEPPERATELLLLDAQCRSAKEQLSQSNAAAITGELGVVLLAQHDFHNLITAPIQWAARYAQDVIWRSGVGVGSVIAIGGGARIQLFCETLAQVTGLPVITDPEPDTVAARGAALIATEFADHLEDEQVNEPEAPVNAAEQSVTAAPASGTRRGALALAGIVATALIVVAGIGLMLGYGGEKSAPANTGVSALPSTSAPATSSVAADGQPAPQTENTPPAAAETAAVPEQAPRRPPVIRRTPPPPPPPAVNIPGLPPIFLPPPLQPAPPPPSGQRPPPIFPGLAPR